MTDDSGADSASLRTRIAALDPAERHHFVTELYSERGWSVLGRDSTAPSGWSVVSVQSPRGGRTATVYVWTGEQPTGDGGQLPQLDESDRLVVSEWPHGESESPESESTVPSERLLDSAALAEQYRYALSPAAQSRLAESVFDTDAATLLDTPPRSSSPSTSPSTPSQTPEAERRSASERPTRGQSEASSDGATERRSEASSGGATERRSGRAGGSTERPRETAGWSHVAGESAHAAAAGGHTRRDVTTVTETDGSASSGGGTPTGSETDGQPGETSETEPGGEGGQTEPGGETQRVAFGGVLLVGIVVVAAAAVGVAPLPPALADALGNDGGPGGADQSFAPGGPPIDRDTDQVPTLPRRAGTDGVPPSVGENDSLPPGVSPDGDLDTTILSARTERVLSNESYRFELTYRERVSGTPTILWREVAHVVNESRYASRVTLLGEPVGQPSYVDQTPVYAADGRLFEQSADGDGVERLDGGTASWDPYLTRTTQYIDWFLTVRESSLIGTAERDGRDVVLLRLREDPWPGVQNTTGVAVVSDRGVVREIHRSYRLPDRPSVRVTVTIRISRVGSTSVSQPAWLTRNGTSSLGGPHHSTTYVQTSPPSSRQ